MTNTEIKKKKKSDKEKKGKKEKKAKKEKKEKVENTNPSKDEEKIDERFIAAVNRPQFQRRKAEKQKVVLDERFASVLTDSRFSVQTKDKYGRKTKKKPTPEAELNEFYVIEKKEADESDTEKDDIENRSSEEKKKTEEPSSRIAYLSALARGELEISESSSDDDSEDSDADLQEEDLMGESGVLDPSSKNEQDEVSITEAPSRYLAVMNMDWAKVRAVDLFAIVSSFTAPGSIQKVQVFPSDYGLEKMEKENISGPLNLWKKNEVINKQDESEEDKQSITGEIGMPHQIGEDYVESDFDPEKLRAYEVSKLKYFFGIVEFSSIQQADIAYKEVDGMEFERSSASIDMRSIHPDQLDDVIKNRNLRDEALFLPSNYEPPEFVVNALQQSNVECTWDEGDNDREQKLTSYVSGEQWQALGESNDFKAYLASDHSSDEDSNASSDSEQSEKGVKMRQLLGLDSDEEDNINTNKLDNQLDSSSENSSNEEKEVSFIPGQSLEEKIRNKIENKDQKELTPWEKYQEKRKQKRRERRQAVRRQRKDVTADNDIKPERNTKDNDDFFVDEQKVGCKEDGKDEKRIKDSTLDKSRVPSSKEELALLMAGDEDEEDAKDYDMRGLMKMDKLKDKKLKGKRKRKKDKLAANVTGGEFKINVKDERFAAVLQGTDDRFGIDRTDTKYKDTGSMREILIEQAKQRKARKRAKINTVVPDISADSMSTTTTSGAAALSSLVKSLKSKVAKKSKSQK
mmetsp:Transcript_33352/g.37933  ORF Transcript_33352/g.37933 Transcript_33352/m.37933 type:complete len:744 (-) Transcript_33352:177-2408(-)